MSKTEYKYYLLRDYWLARLEKDCPDLYPKEFFINGVWQYDDKLNLELNDSIMDYGDSSVFDYDKISEEEALKHISAEYGSTNNFEPDELIGQMVDGIVGKGKGGEDTRRRLAGRAAECLMFMDDDECGEICKSTDESASHIIAFPDFEKLKAEVERLRTELSMLLLERDELQFVICRNIETAYYLALGSSEYKAYEAECTALRLKRKLEMIQAKINRQEKVVISSIEAALDKEFEEYQAKLNEQVEKMNEAIKRNEGEFLTPAETKELKKIYRNVVKNLHPDLHPEITEAQVRLFENAVSAYKNGDLNTLRIIEEMVIDHQLPETQKDAMSQLVEEKKRLEDLAKLIREGISKIKSEYPYTVKEIVENQEKIEERKAELKSIAEQYREMIESYKSRIQEILG